MLLEIHGHMKVVGVLLGEVASENISFSVHELGHTCESV